LAKPRIGIFGLTGCGGDQLQILNMEDELLELMAKFNILDFQEGSSYIDEGPLDIAFVEGTVSSEKDLHHLRKIRDRTSILVALGNCATEGCVQAMRNKDTTLAERMKEVYGTKVMITEALEPQPLDAYVKVDHIIPGCPVEKDEVLKGITSLLNGDSPPRYPYPVCVECKILEYPCLIVEQNKPCLGPVVRAGCKDRCPGLGIDCIGCRGPVEGGGNYAAELKMLLDKGYTKEYIVNRLKVFSGKFSEDLMEDLK
jgi:sulfhydrogenase subunit delta